MTFEEFRARVARLKTCAKVSVSFNEEDGLTLFLRVVGIGEGQWTGDLDVVIQAETWVWSHLHDAMTRLEGPIVVKASA